MNDAVSPEKRNAVLDALRAEEARGVRGGFGAWPAHGEIRTPPRALAADAAAVVDFAP